MNAISLFSGVGGLELGMERAGIRTVLQCEIDPVALSVLRRHWPDVPKVEDVRTLTAATVARILEGPAHVRRDGVMAGRDGCANTERLREPGAGLTGGFRSTDLEGMGAYVPSYWDGGQLADTLDVLSMLTKGQMMPDKRRMAVVICNGLRRLMPMEAERIMGWPSDWTKWRDDGSEIPDSHRYRLIGNGVVSTVAEWIGYRLVAADAETRA